jgi:hypothetical protein
LKKVAKYNDAEKGRELMRRIQAAGIPVNVDVAKDSALLIRQDFEAYESMIFDVNAGAGIVLPLKITPIMPEFVFSDFHVELPRWENAWFRLLEETDTSDWRHYEFYERSELKFNRDESMNRFVGDQRVMRRDRPATGLLLAFSSAPMPDDIKRGEMLEASLKIYDQFEHAHSASIRLRAERDAVREPRLKSEEVK